jgi:hypothetical protein
MKVPVGTTFVVAASLLGAAAVAQLVAVLIYFGPGFARPAEATAEPSPAPAAVTVTAEAMPGPSPAVDREEASRQKRMAELFDEINVLEAGSSPGSALVPLEEAVTLDPRNPEVLHRLASLHERLGDVELAKGTWKNLLDLGPDAGRFLDVAEVRLRLLRQENVPPPTGMALRDQIGLQPGSTLGIVDLTVKDTRENGVPYKDLRMAVKARPNETIEGSQVRIDVTFYEMINNEVVPTESRVRPMWFTTPADWKDDGIEILEVRYEVPQLGAGLESSPIYYGYMVNIYYRGDLQETRADPVDLQELSTPALTQAPQGEVPGPMESLP